MDGLPLRELLEVTLLVLLFIVKRDLRAAKLEIDDLPIRKGERGAAWYREVAASMGKITELERRVRFLENRTQPPHIEVYNVRQEREGE
jgi:hypothetical protein